MKKVHGNMPWCKDHKELWYENLGINKTLTTCTAGKLRLGYPKSIIPEEMGS